MGIEFKASSGIKLGNITTFNNTKNVASNVFKNKFYDDIEDIDYSKYEDVDYNVIDLEKGIKEAEKNEKKGFWENIGHVLASTGATILVGFTSLLSGIADVGESIVDGGAGLVATIGDLCGCDTTGIKEFVARDLVSEANNALYGEGGFLSGVNKASYMKYDSAVAQGIRNVTKDVTKIAAATALSAVPGAGPFLVAGVGFLDGYGEAAENTWKNGTDTTGWQYASMFGSGALGSLSWYAEGKFGKELFSIGKKASEEGIKVVGKEFANTVFNKEFLKKSLKDSLLSKQAIGNYISSAMMTADDVIPYITGTKEFSAGDLAYLLGQYGINLSKNVVEDLFRDGVHYQSSKINALNGDLSSINKIYSLQQYREDIGDIEFLKKFNNLSNEDIYRLGNMADDDILKLLKENLTGSQLETLKKTVRFKEFEVLEVFKSSHMDMQNIDNMSFSQIQKLYPEEIKKITIDNYIRDVVNGKVETALVNEKMWKYASKKYDSLYGDGSFDKLSWEQKVEYTDTIQLSQNQIDQLNTLKAVKISEATKVAKKTVDDVEAAYQAGMYKKGYTLDQVLRMIQDDVPQEQYLKESVVKAWRAKYNKAAAEAGDLNAPTNIYIFQCGDVGAKNFIRFGGNIGASDGKFALCESEYLDIIADRTIFNEKGECIDIAKLSNRLGGVPLGSNPICIKETVRLGDIKMSKGSLSTAYFGEFDPIGGKTQGGLTEGIVAQSKYFVDGKLNPNIEIFSHSKNFTTEDLEVRAYVELS